MERVNTPEQQDAAEHSAGVGSAARPRPSPPASQQNFPQPAMAQQARHDSADDDDDDDNDVVVDASSSPFPRYLLDAPLPPEQLRPERSAAQQCPSSPDLLDSPIFDEDDPLHIVVGAGGRAAQARRNVNNHVTDDDDSLKTYSPSVRSHATAASSVFDSPAPAIESNNSTTLPDIDDDDNEPEEAVAEDSSPPSSPILEVFPPSRLPPSG